MAKIKPDKVVIFTEDVGEYKDNLWTNDLIVIKTRREVVVNNNTLYYVTKNYTTGVDRNGGHRYWRWSTDQCDLISINKKGQIYNRTMVRGRGKLLFGGDARQLFNRFEFYNRTIAQRQENNPNFGDRYIAERYRKESWDIFYHKALEMFGPINIETVYPQLAKPIQESGFNYTPLNIKEYKEKDPIDFVKTLFGASSYRKDLVKAVARNNDPLRLNFAKQFRHLVPIDWIIDFLEMYAGIAPVFNLNLPVDVQINTFRDIVKSLSMNDRHRILSEPFSSIEYRMLGDVLRDRTAQRYNGRGRTVREIHDSIYDHRFNRAYRVAITPVASAISATKVADKIIKTPICNTEYSIKPAEHTDELYQWSEKMRNCISSYTRSALKEDTPITLGAVYKNDNLIANFEIYNHVLKQLLGSCNQPLPVEDRKPIEEYFKSIGVRCEEYWGHRVEQPYRIAPFILGDLNV
jgi:hypothetical protein